MHNKKIALVTGSNKGIGLSIAKKFKEENWVVIQNSRNEILKDSSIDDAYIYADVTKPDEAANLIKQIKDRYGHIDAIVCNVGSGKNFKNNNFLERWQHYLEINLLSATNLIDYALPILDNSSVIVISSICGSVVIEDAPLEYSVAKAALNHYVNVMAKKYAKNNINFNSISPGNVLFEGSTWDEKIKRNKSEIEMYIKKTVPMGKFIEPRDIAELVYFLSSDKNRFITGQNIIVDGGQSL